MATNTTASIALTATHSGLASALRTAGQMVSNFAQHTRNAMAAVAMAPGKFAGKIWNSAVGSAAFRIGNRGVQFLAEQAAGVFDFERKLIRLGIAARSTPEALNEIRNAARDTSLKTGIDPSVVLDSYRAYVDLAGAQSGSIEKMKILSRAGQASEAEGKDLAGMMYQLTRSMKVADDQMEDTMGGLINQAKDGAIEAKQMAAEFAGMMPIFARFGIVGREGAIQLGAMYQVTRDGFDSAAQASTGMIRLMAGFQRHASRFKNYGVEVFKPGSKKDLRDLSDIMEQVKKSPLNKDIEALIKAFGRSEAWRTFELLAEAPERLKDLEAAGRVLGVVQQDSSRFVESTAGRIDIASTRIKNAFANALTPERIDQIVSGIGAMADAMPPLMNAVSKVADGFSNFIHLASRAKQALTGDSKMELSERDRALVYMLEEGERSGVSSMPAQQREEAQKIRARKKAYDKSMGDIMGSESDWGATDASIKKAIRLANSAMGHNPALGDQAGLDYLSARKSEISDDRYKRINSEVEAERQKAMTNYARSQEGYARAEAQDRAAGERATELFNQQIKPLVEETTKRLGETISKALGGSFGNPTKINIDGNPVATANGNATDRRRK